MGNGCARMAMSFNGTVLIVAGPLGLFRRCVLEDVFLQYGQMPQGLKEGQSADEASILAWWRSFFGFIGKSKFLTGRSEGKRDNPFKADLEWIIRPTNFAKIIERKYHGD